MAETFNCPACGGPLMFDREAGITIRCPYCHNTVIVPDELRFGLRLEGVASADEQPQSMKPVLPQINSNQVEKEIRALLAARQKINAIKFYRQVTGAGLKQAKEAVEAIEAGGTLDAGLLNPHENRTYLPKDDASTISQAAQLVKEGDKIAAIRLLRNHYDVSLKVAKDATDLLEKGQTVDMEWLKMRANQAASSIVKLPSEPVNRGSRSLLLWVCFSGVLLVLAFIFLMAFLR
jgi:ribosomal protein L7/L12